MSRGEDGLQGEPWVENGEHILGRGDCVNELRTLQATPIDTEQQALLSLSHFLCLQLVVSKSALFCWGKWPSSCTAKDI